MSEKKLDWRLVLGIIALMGVLVLAVVLNLGANDTTVNKFSGAIDVDNGDQKINWNRYDVVDVKLQETYEITKSGVYHFTGAIEDGLLLVNIGREDEVKMILDNVSIKNSSGPAIACYDGNDLVIEVVGKNYLEDSETYSVDYDEDVKGAIYSRADLTIQGGGSLNLVANHEDGIVGKDDLKFNSGTYNINAKDDAIRGKDSVYVVDGEFHIVSGADAIKATNETTVGKGFVMIDGGDFTIDAGAKGIKSINTVVINKGDYNLKTYDDAIHSDGYIGIVDGDIIISSGDDGIHANKELVIDGGRITIEKAYEGLEAQAVTINGGAISLVAMDDGINAGGGVDASASNRPGAGFFDASVDCAISINGGYVYVNASGDGIDSNGRLYFNGGKVVVDGPTNNKNGALDATAGIMMNGGEVIAVGASGMAEGLGLSSNIYNVSVYFGKQQSAGTTIKIEDTDGGIVLEHTSAKTFNHLAVGTDKFNLGDTYTIYLDNEKYQDFTITDISTVIGGDTGSRNFMPPSR